jgi:hypothetical protein
MTGYREKKIPPHLSQLSTAELRERGFILTEHTWINRILFLEASPSYLSST